MNEIKLEIDGENSFNNFINDYNNKQRQSKILSSKIDEEPVQVVQLEEDK
jgi:hypothetical protein